MDNHKFSNHNAISKDKTIITYKTIGTGIPIIIIPGALSTTEDFTSFAIELSTDFEVNIIERRGRGESGDMGSNYSILTELEDLTAVQEKTKSKFLFGHSYGGLIGLEFGRESQLFTKIAVYDPGISMDNSISIKWADTYAENLRAGKPIEAFIDFIIGSGSAPKLPKWYFKIILKIVLGKNKLDKIFALLPQNLLEHQQIVLLNNTYKNYENIKAKFLLMSGGRSPKLILGTMQSLKNILINAEFHSFKKLDHFGPSEKGSKEVALRLKTFYLT